jgi:uncharacterized membrane protein
MVDKTQVINGHGVMILNRHFSPEKVYVFIVVTFGLGFLFLVPPFQTPDEYQHFSRSYVVSEGHLFDTDGYIPQGIVKLMAVTRDVPFHLENKVKFADLADSINQPLQQSDLVHTDFPASAVYSPIPYMISALGIFVGRVLGASPLIIFYLGRAFNLVIWASLVYLALHLTPVYKWVFLLLFLSPMSLNQAASYSADSLTNALSFFTICYCLYLAFTVEKTINLKDLLPLFVLALLLPLTKPPYAALIGLFLLIPASKFGSAKRYLMILTLLVGITSVLIWFGSSINREYYYRFVPYPGVNANRQTVYILRHLSGYSKTIIRTLSSDFVFITQSYVGILGWLDTKLPQLIYPTFYLIVFFLALIDHSVEIRLSIWQKLILALVACAGFLMIATGQYITWTPVGASKINAIQGRYLIPIIPPLILLLHNHRLQIREFFLQSIASLYLGLILIITMVTLFLRYYQL